VRFQGPFELRAQQINEFDTFLNTKLDLRELIDESLFAGESPRIR